VCVCVCVCVYGVGLCVFEDCVVWVCVCVYVCERERGQVTIEQCGVGGWWPLWGGVCVCVECGVL